MALVATRTHSETWGLGHNVWPLMSLGVMLQPGPYRSGWPVLPPRAMSGSVTLEQPGSGLMSVAPAATEGHVESMLLSKGHAVAKGHTDLSGLLMLNVMVTSGPELQMRACVDG